MGFSFSVLQLSVCGSWLPGTVLSSGQYTGPPGLPLVLSWAQVEWLGRRGMYWSGLLSFFQEYKSSLPYLLLVLLGSNDFSHLKGKALVKQLRGDFGIIKGDWPGLQLSGWLWYPDYLGMVHWTHLPLIGLDGGPIRYSRECQRVNWATFKHTLTFGLLTQRMIVFIFPIKGWTFFLLDIQQRLREALGLLCVCVGGYDLSRGSVLAVAESFG